MVFHEIDSISDVLSGHRIILYFIENNVASSKTGRNEAVYKHLEIMLEKLQKKNDDLVIIKVINPSECFNQFQDIYKAEVTGMVTLFAVNNEGIPLICEQVIQEENIFVIIESLTKTCQLSCVPKSEITKIGLYETVSESVADSNPVDVLTPKVSDSQVQDVGESSSSGVITSSDVEHPQQAFTELQIRLPNGNKEKLKFKKDAMLQEVWVSISVKYNLKNFDLKTYDQTFSEEDYEKSLEDLQLFPNGVLIVVLKNITHFNNRPNGGITAWFHYSVCQVMAKTTSVFRYIQGLLFIFWNSFFFNNNDDQTRRQIRPRSQGDSSQPSTSQKKSTSKRSGNIHTLRGNDDSDDENNRYNGNSTQQK